MVSIDTEEMELVVGVERLESQSVFHLDFTLLESLAFFAEPLAFTWTHHSVFQEFDHDHGFSFNGS